VPLRLHRLVRLPASSVKFRPRNSVDNIARLPLNRLDGLWPQRTWNVLHHQRHADKLTSATSTESWARLADVASLMEEGASSGRKGSLHMLKPFHPNVFAHDWHWIPRALWI